ncbi:DUF5723 family protein [Polaribacter porphyrae]|uniref:DUF5723 domain-containing protein n=1 Tax=Polaribacter porphyrae TaxID=1137780 RepID=A0A2S7WNM5_9FLAO|nr:DUF5723 family protein [Polaribacter porphyrae]PQJ79215.1 hypothetical protein BTO18_08540 [Polaribacter porphyrae]
MRKIIFILIVLFFYKSIAQNKQVLFGFAELPQTLLLNPASETNYKFHVGVPLLSGFSTEIGSSSAVLSDLFGVDNRTVNQKVTSLLNSLSPRDFLKLNTQIEILSGGFRYDSKNYFSFGFYNEIDAIGYYPKDFLTLFNEGNDAYLNRSFSASQIIYKLDVIGVLHAGITRKINDKLTVGGRFKIYSSALNIETNNNSGTFTTTQGTNNLYTHYFNDVDINLKTSGLVDSNTEQYIENAGTFIGNTFLGGNLGIGLDVGLTYKITDQLEFSGSIIDFGFINHKKNVKNTKTKGNFIFEGVDFTFDPNNNGNYWEQIDERFKQELPTTEDNESYISWRPTKINAALKYSFGEKRSKYCYDNTYKDFYTDAIGVQLFNVFRPLSPQLALTTFYQKSISKKIHAKFTYTIDDFSYSNIGAGLSMQFGKINLYGMFDNILAYRNLATANSVSLQLGVNLIFN